MLSLSLHRYSTWHISAPKSCFPSLLFSILPCYWKCLMKTLIFSNYLSQLTAVRKVTCVGNKINLQSNSFWLHKWLFGLILNIRGKASCWPKQQPLRLGGCTFQFSQHDLCFYGSCNVLSVLYLFSLSKMPGMNCKWWG